MERRRDPRFPYPLQVTVTWRRREFPARSEDVSFTGLSVRTEARPAERELIAIRAALPPDGISLQVQGMVARRLAPTETGATGLGIRLYALSREEHARWIRFVRLAAGLSPAKYAAGAPRLAPASSGGRVGRAVRLELRFGALDELQALCDHDLTTRGLVVGTPLALPPGTPVRVTLLHPRTGEQFPLDAVVRWRASDPRPGVGLELTSLTGSRRGELREFVRSELPVEQVVYAARPHALAARGP